MDLKDRIVQAALEIFGEYGYEKATIAQIVERSGSSKGGFYHHFASKKEVLEEITNRFFKEIVKLYESMLQSTENDTIYLLNTVFSSLNDYKKQRLSDWKELINIYAHKDSDAIVQKMAFDFIDLLSGIYEKLILKGIEQGLFSPASPKALAEMWTHEVTRLYGKVTEIIVNKGDEKLYEDFLSRAQFVEDTINHALNADGAVISIKQPAVEYLDMTMDMMKKMDG
ncbi:MAG: TetR/AcrR family transcriptional regulator [Eubacteriales bacterium]